MISRGVTPIKRRGYGYIPPPFRGLPLTDINLSRVGVTPIIPIQKISSVDGSIIITDPSGPVVDLSVAPDTEPTILLAGYDIVDTTPEPPLPGVGYAINEWTFEAGVDFLNLDDPNNPAVPYDGIYTWNIVARYDIGVSPVGSFAGYEWISDWQFSTIGDPLFSQAEIILPLTVVEGYPQLSTSYRLPMRAGDTIEEPFGIHNVPEDDPHFSSLRGVDINLIVLWEKIVGPFPSTDSFFGTRRTIKAPRQIDNG